MAGSIILGIDPGKSGALAFYDPATGALTVNDMPSFKVKGAAGIDLFGLARLLDNAGDRVRVAYVEKVGAMPGQGVSSMFAFGYAVGAVESAIASWMIPIERVTPSAWKRAIGVPADKDGARRRASELMPAHAGQWTRAKDHGRAEAALIALHGARQAPQATGWPVPLASLPGWSDADWHL